jgi:hypothetical protein
MGWFGSSEENDIDNKGSVNSNITITETVPIHNDHLITLLYIIAIIKCLEFFYILFKSYNKMNKKKYLNRAASINNLV